MKNVYIYKGVNIEWETEEELAARKAQIDAQDEAYLALLLGTAAPTESVEAPVEPVETPAESVEVETHVSQSESEADSELAVEPSEVDASLEAEVEVTPKKKRNRKDTK